MIFETVALIALGLAAAPCSLFLLNLLVYRPIRRETRPVGTPPGMVKPEPESPHLENDGISVLIPARNEERNLPATLASLLRNRDCDCEIVVLDDHSTDSTVSIVRQFAALDPRVRIEKAPALPVGWCGKQHACYVLAREAKRRWLVFLDADVRLAPDALKRMVAFMEKRQVALASGVPRQELGTLSERLLLPLIHFVLLCFLPMHAMRRTRWPAMSAGCGQLFIARREAYQSCGGHARLRDSLHDGLRLPRVFRRGGFPTDLFDATDLATCRMYHSHLETWSGLAKNATEGLAAPVMIVPMTAWLLGGQVLPFALLCAAAWLPRDAVYAAGWAALLAYTPRLVGAWLFRQPFGSVLFHPFGVLALVAIQWHALIRRLLGRPAEWKGRRYGTVPAPRIARALGLIVTGVTFLLSCESVRAGESPQGWTRAPATVELHDQFESPRKLSFPTTNVVILTIADRKGVEEVEGWIAALKPLYAGHVDFRGLANVAGVPRFLQAKLRRKFQEARKYPVMMDWCGTACAQYGYERGVANVLIIDRDGRIRARFYGNANPAAVHSARDAVDAALASAESKERAPR